MRALMTNTASSRIILGMVCESRGAASHDPATAAAADDADAHPYLITSRHDAALTARPSVHTNCMPATLKHVPGI